MPHTRFEVLSPIAFSLKKKDEDDVRLSHDTPHLFLETYDGQKFQKMWKHIKCHLVRDAQDKGCLRKLIVS
jgi:hypothetical protein